MHHRRKARKASDLARKKASRAPYSKILIVCEGEKTEPNYFNELKDHLALNSANVMVSGECGSSPVSVVNYAIQIYVAERSAGDPFDKVFCVFDKDSHETYQQALDKIAGKNQRLLDGIVGSKLEDIFVATTSVPCFEYWLLLHFDYTSAPFQGAGSKSACDQLVGELRKYMPDYQKGNESIFNQLLDKQPKAMVFAENSLRAAEENANDNPSTRVHELIKELQGITQVSGFKTDENMVVTN